jgi:hypothetical protein
MHKSSPLLGGRKSQSLSPLLTTETPLGQENSPPEKMQKCKREKKMEKVQELEEYMSQSIKML